MVATVTPNQPTQDDARAMGPTSEDASSVQDRRIDALEQRVERQSHRRDGANLLVFVLSALALVAGAVSVGLGTHAITESKRNVKSAAAILPSAAVGVSHIALSEFKVALPATAFTPGQLSVTMSNAGTEPHELLVFRSNLDASAYPVDAAGNILEEDAAITKVSDGANVDPGSSQDRMVDLTVPGKYVFVCNLPGHFKSGMFTQVTVG
jgi:uncharacterized cupredoxin-like copper-binding protein